MRLTDLLVLVDSSREAEYSIARETVVSALNHFGMVYRVLDRAREVLTHDRISPYSCVVVAQEGLGISSFMSQIATYVSSGGGFIDLGGEACAETEIVGLACSGSYGTFTSFNIAKNRHYVTGSYHADERFCLKKSLEFLESEIVSPSDVSILLSTPDGAPLSVAGRHGRGRVFKSLFPLRFWLPEYFGHLNGLDTFFYRAFVWTARKPFVTMAMPPFVTARIDDCSGSGSIYAAKPDSAATGFAYIDILNHFGFVPNIGLFTDDVVSMDSGLVREKYERGLAQFSPHAFTEDAPGKNNLIYIKHTHDTQGAITGVEEYSQSELKENFLKLDGQFRNWGIEPSKTVNAHYQNPGVNSLAFLREREQVNMMVASRFGTSYYDPRAYDWRPKPYGHPGFVCDYMVDYPDFFIVEAHPHEVSPEGKITDADIDFLWSNTTFSDENPVYDMEAAADKALSGIRLSLDSLFFACVFTHEQRIASLSTREWEAVIEQIDAYVRENHMISKSYDYITEYCKSRYDTDIVRSEYEAQSNVISLWVAGSSTLPLELQVFTDEGESCILETKEVPRFEREKEFDFIVGQHIER